jgi:hypothetical protein
MALAFIAFVTAVLILGLYSEHVEQPSLETGATPEATPNLSTTPTPTSPDVTVQPTAIAPDTTTTATLSPANVVTQPTAEVEEPDDD